MEDKRESRNSKRNEVAGRRKQKNKFWRNITWKEFKVGRRAEIEGERQNEEKC